MNCQHATVCGKKGHVNCKLHSKCVDPLAGSNVEPFFRIHLASAQQSFSTLRACVRALDSPGNDFSTLGYVDGLRGMCKALRLSHGSYFRQVALKLLHWQSIKPVALRP